MTKEQVNALVVIIKSYYPTAKFFENELEVAVWRDELAKYNYDYCIEKVKSFCKHSENIFEITLPNIIDVCEQGQAEYYKDCEIKKAEEYRKAHPTIPMSDDEKKYKELERKLILKRGCLIAYKKLNINNQIIGLENEINEIKIEMSKLKI